MLPLRNSENTSINTSSSSLDHLSTTSSDSVSNASAAIAAAAAASCSHAALMAAVKSLNVAVSGLNSAGGTIAPTSSIAGNNVSSISSSLVANSTASGINGRLSNNENTTGGTMLISTGVTLNRKSKMMLKKTNNDRKYPCGFPGCEWVFTRTNHVLRHQQRVHPGWATPFPKFVNRQRPNGSSLAQVTVSPIAAAFACRLLDQTPSGNKRCDSPIESATAAVSCNSPNSAAFSTSTGKQTLPNLCVTANSPIESKTAAKSRLDHRLNTAIRRYQCNVNHCGLKFTSELQFHNHLKSSHGVDRTLLNKQNAQTNRSNVGNIVGNNNNINNVVSSSGSAGVGGTTVSSSNRTSKNLTSLSVGGSTQFSNNLKLLLSNKHLNKDAFGAYLSSLTSSLKLHLLPTTTNSTSSTTISNPNTLSSGGGNNNNNHSAQQSPQLQVPHIQSVVVQPKLLISSSNGSRPNTPETSCDSRSISSQSPSFSLTNALGPSTTCTPISINSHPNSSSKSTNPQILLAKLRSDSSSVVQSNGVHITQVPSSSSSASPFYHCPLNLCGLRFDCKERLDDHLFYEHRVLEPQLCIRCEDGSDWLNLPDPQPMREDDDDDDCNLQGHSLPLDLNNNSHHHHHHHHQHSLFSHQPTTKLSRSPDEPTLATAFGVVKQSPITRLDNVNKLSNIAATTQATYAGLAKKHYCDVGNCTKSFAKRYHLVRHKLEAHQIGRQSMKSKLPDNHHEEGDEFVSPATSTPSSTGDSLKLPFSDEETVVPAKQAKLLINSKSNSSSKMMGSNGRLLNKVTTGQTSNFKLSTRQLNGIFNKPPPTQEYRPFKCRYPNCGWSFKRQYHLKRHVRTHKNYEEIVQSLLMQEHTLLLPFTSSGLQSLLNSMPSQPAEEADANNNKPDVIESESIDKPSNDESMNDERSAVVSFLEKIDLRAVKKPVPQPTIENVVTTITSTSSTSSPTTIIDTKANVDDKSLVNSVKEETGNGCLNDKSGCQTAESADDSGYPDDDCSVIEERHEEEPVQKSTPTKRISVPIDNRLRPSKNQINKNSALLSIMQQKHKPLLRNSSSSILKNQFNSMDTSNGHVEITNPTSTTTTTTTTTTTGIDTRRASIVRSRRGSKNLTVRSSPSPPSVEPTPPVPAPTPMLDRSVVCDYPNCGRTFSALKYYRQHYTVHEKHEQKLIKKLAESGSQRSQSVQESSGRSWVQ